MGRRKAFGAVAGLALVGLAAGPPSGKTEPAPLPPLNAKVLEFARGKVGQKVADGLCTSLAAEAVRQAGARMFPFDPSGDFVWGRPVASFREALPGDILQFRNAVFQGKKYVTKRRWVSWRQEYPHHTAVLSEVRDGGREVTVLHQNVGPPDAADATKKVVQSGVLRTDSLRDGGRVWIYRPVTRDDHGLDGPP